MMSVMNVMCGNVEMECAYAVLKEFNIRRDERNIFEQIGQSCHMNQQGSISRKMFSSDRGRFQI